VRGWNPEQRISIEDVRAGVRFLRDLPPFLRRPWSEASARAALRTRFERRETDFVELVRRAVYENATSPYRALLRWAGCEYGDLRGLVARDGLEGALQGLARAGVYLTVDQFKGRAPVVRGSTTLSVDSGRLRNPSVRAYALAQSSGSRGARTAVPVDLRFIRDLGANICLTTAARGGLRWRHATWTIPGSAAMAAALSYSAFGSHWVHWFSQVDPRARALHPRYRWSARIMTWGGMLAGVSLPMPRHVPLENPRPIVDWLAATLEMGETPHLLTFPSSAVRVCAAARDAGQSLQGAQFMLGGEPITSARLEVIDRAGADVTTGYGTAETGPCGVGDGCLSREAPDEVHVFHDLHALIQPEPGTTTPQFPPGTLLASSVRPTAPVILLNVSLGDQATLTRRRCGCPLERLGWTTHLVGIRSREKLTSAGMSFLDGDVVRVLEQVLPARFGGGPTDYQLVEEEGPQGRPRLRLLVHPALGPLDPKALVETFLEGIGGGVGIERLMGLVWREAGLVEVDRQPPRVTASGKILHVHVEPTARTTAP
jgi:hypothetical protein